MITYFLIVLIPLFLWSFSKNTKINFYYLMIIFLAIIAGSRFEIGGYDYFVYQAAYQHVPTILSPSLLRGNVPYLPYEPMFIISMSIANLIGLNFNQYLLIFAIAALLLIGKGIRKLTDDYFFVFILYVLNSYIWQNFTVIRSSMAFAVVINLIPLIWKKKPISFFIGVLFAATWHISALIFLLAYFFLRKDLSNRRVIIYGLLCIVFMLCLDNFAALSASLKANTIYITKLEGYLRGNGPGIGPFQAFECIVFLLLCLPIYKREISNYTINYSYKLTFSVLLLTIAFHRYQALARLYEYLKIGIIIIAVCWTKDRIKQLEPIKCLLVLCYFIIKYIRYIIIFDNGALVPYKSFLFG